MSAIGRRSLLAVTAISLPMLFPLSAVGDATAPRSEAGIKIINSDDFPRDQTGPAGKKGGFVVLADSPEADRLRLSLDGQELPERSFSILGKTVSTRFEITPAPGVHKLSLTVIDKAGQVGETKEYSFSARAVPALPAGKAAAAEAPIVVGGRFVEADGSPAVNLPVAVHMVLAAIGKEQAPLATATTRADGTWEAQIVDLPADVEKLAAENNGVLNLQARASGVTTNPSTGQPRAMSGVSAFSTGVVTSAGLSEAALRARQSSVVSSPLLPVFEPSEIPPTPTAPETEPVEQRSPLTTQEKEYFEPTYFEFKAAYGDEKAKATENPRIVDGVDYTSLPVVPEAAAPTRTPASPGHQCVSEGGLVTQRPRAAAGYTKALESHAYQDAFGTVLYMNQASTNVTYGISSNGGSSWGVGGSNSVDNKISWASGFEMRGPHFSREWRIPIIYAWLNIYKCVLVKGVRTLKYQESAIVPEGARIPNGGKNGELGADVLSDDGWYGYRDAPYKFEVTRGTMYQADRERALTYSGAVSVYGFSVAATTIKGVGRSQRIDAGNQSLRHMVFGHSPISKPMKVFYSY